MKKQIAAVATAAAITLGGGGAFAVQQANAAPTAYLSTQAASSMPVTKYGSEGAKVKLVQRALAAHGIEVDADGKFGPATKAAVIKFQKKKNLGADGVVGPKTWSKLLPVLKSGSSGAMVKVLQTSLNDHGAKLKVDGKFGADTQKALKSFQSKNKLTSDGVAGPATWGRIAGVKSGGGGNGPKPAPGTGPDKRYSHPKKSGKFSNGKLPSSQLCTVPWSTKDRVACYMLPDLEALNKAHKARFGSNISITGNNNAYRTYAVQVHYWNTLPRGQAARPGTSNHGWGLAIDISNTGGHGGERYNWLNANAGKYGFDDNVSSEAWHWEYER